MKRIYIMPETQTIALEEMMELLANSKPQPGRYDEGGPNDEGFPGDIKETDKDTDPFGGHGQGTGGGGNRGKEFDLWGFDSFDLWN